MKYRIAHSRQALPNGYCGLPLVQTCPHPNACLSRDNFLTDRSFSRRPRPTAPAHPDHARHARERDTVRLIEVLERDHQSLTRILDGLDALDANTEPTLDLIAHADHQAAPDT